MLATSKVRIVVSCVLGIGMLMLVIFALPALAIFDTSPILSPDRASADVYLEDRAFCTNKTVSESVNGLSTANDVTRSSLLLNDVLTYFVYLPLTQKCYGMCGACMSNGQGGREVIATISSSCLATKILVDMNKRATGYGFSLFEVEAYAPDDPGMINNLLIDGECCTSSVEGNNPIWGCDRAIDGLMSTRWSSDWYEPQWLVITLPEPEVVKYVVLKWETAYAIEYQVNVINSDVGCP
ncbi:MAG TPA: discoidin domain-containing protein [Anaerolineae bacterium]|nr:discoidin domain-containing protein [Anaerolineae bacterium]HQI85165.1 discoidin domain-containing protein [Anaerolineae bacterium]